MPRSRQIKPDYYRDEQLALCSRDARLLLPGLWILADRSGRLADRPARIRARVFPYDADLGPREIDGLLSELERQRFIARREECIHILEWRRWQGAVALRERIPSAARRKVLSSGSCAACGSTGKLTVDHKVPVASGGSNAIENLQCLCSACNSRKSNRKA
jgi:5-methylcytosine-specific restriction endonuclease McrA